MAFGKPCHANSKIRPKMFTDKGNQLLGENIAKVILRELFGAVKAGASTSSP